MRYRFMSKKGEISTVFLLIALGVMMLGGVIGSLTVRRERVQLNTRAQGVPTATPTGVYCNDSDGPRDATTNRDVNTAGEVRTNQGTTSVLKDVCRRSTTTGTPDDVTEYYCDTNNAPQSIRVNCNTQCNTDSEGRGYCVSNTTAPTATPTGVTPPTATPTTDSSVTPTPEPPRNISASCTNTQARLTWDAPANTRDLIGYAVRVDDLTDGEDGSCDTTKGNYCFNDLAVEPKNKDVSPMQPGHKYRWWIHSRYNNTTTVGTNPPGWSEYAIQREFICNLGPSPTATPTVTPTPGTISGIVRLTWDNIQPQTANVYIRIWKMNTSNQVVSELPLITANRRLSDASNNTYDYSFKLAYDDKYVMRAFASVTQGIYGNGEVDCAGRLSYYGCIVDKNATKDFTVNITSRPTPTQSIPQPTAIPTATLTPTPGDKTYQLDFIPNPTNSPNYPGRNCSIVLKVPLTGTPAVASVTGELRDGTTTTRVECQAGFENNTLKLKAKEVRLYLNQIATVYSLRRNVCPGLVNSCTTSVGTDNNTEWAIQHSNTVFNELNCTWDIQTNTAICTKQNVPNVTPGLVEGQQAQEIAQYDLNNDGVISIVDFQQGKQKWCFAGVRSNCALKISKLISVIGIRYRK